MEHYFVALELDSDTRKKIFEEFVKPLKKLKRVPEENLHITLCFIGKGDEEKILKRLSRIRFNRFNALIGCVGRFGSKVVWLSAESDDLAELSEKIFDALGKSRERKLHGHVTLARGNNPKHFFEEFRKIREKRMDKEISVREFALMKSASGPRGPKYERVKSFSLFP